jgi:hypothetical protein
MNPSSDPAPRSPVSRRRFLGIASTIAAGGAVSASFARAEDLAPPLAGTVDAAAADTRALTKLPLLENRPMSIAAIITEYRPWSHADVIIGRFIQGLSYDVSPHWPDIRVRAMYIDQTPATDLSRPLSKAYGIPIAATIRDAILDEKGALAVGGVVLIGEHGDYPHNERGQHLYPRRRFFEETVAAFREAGAVVPVFNDKHLAARSEDGLWMYETAKALGIPFLAGSSLPLAWRRPWLEIPIGTPLEGAVAVGYSDLEAYGYHALETLQCMIERRAGGESGVAAVTCLVKDAVWAAVDDGRIPRDLLDAALARHDPPVSGDYRGRARDVAAFLIEHVDGFRSSVVMLEGLVGGFLFAARTKGDVAPIATQFWLQEPRFGHFSYLAGAIQDMVRSGVPRYPVERTVLTTGVLSTAMDSRFEGQRRIETPSLHISYTPTDHDLGAYRHPEASNARSGGWIELFNGRDLDGWRENRFRHEPRWEVRDGVLRGSGGQGYLATWEEFEDFELFAEVRISDTAGGRGNSGIFIRCQPHLDRTKEYPDGLQVQCDHGDPNNPTGSISALGVEGARAAPAKARDGEWFTIRVITAGDQLRTWVNGDPAADCRDTVRGWKKGSILLALQHRSGLVEFRQVRIRPLSR